MKRLSRFFVFFALVVVPATGILSVPGRVAAQDVAALKAELARAEAVNAQLKARTAKLEAALTEEMAASDRIIARLEHGHKTVEATLRREVTRLRKDVMKLQTDRDSRFEKLVTAVDQLHKAEIEMAKLKAENAKLAARYPARSQSVARPAREGLVTSVSKEGRIEISIGTDAGVLTGHTLYAYRVFTKATGYVGQVRVIESSPGKAVCEAIAGTLGGRTIQKGDRVSATRRTPTPGEPP